MNNGEFNNYEEINFDFQPPMDTKKESETFSRIGIGLAALTLTVMLSSFVIIIAARLIENLSGISLVDNIWFANMISPICIYACGLPVLWMIIRRLPATAPEKRSMKLSAWLLILLVGLGMMYIGAYVGNSVMEGLSQYLGHQYENALEGLIDPGNLWISAIFMVVVAPVGEEFIFRKLLIDRMSKYGSVIAIVISALAFALMHGTFYQFFYAFALGLVLGYVYFNTGKLYLTIGIHAALNFVGSILSSLLQNGLFNLTADLEKATDANIVEVMSAHLPTVVAMIVFEIVVFGSMICAVVIPIAHRKRIIIKNGEVDIPRGQRFSTVIMNTGMLIMLVVYAITFILDLVPLA